MRRLVYLISARQDLRDIMRYLTESSGSRAVGRAFVDRLRSQCAKLASLPGTLGRARPELGGNLRSFVFRGYVIFFRYGDDRFEIVDILEGHLDFDERFSGDASADDELD